MQNSYYPTRMSMLQYTFSLGLRRSKVLETKYKQYDTYRMAEETFHSDVFLVVRGEFRPVMGYLLLVVQVSPEGKEHKSK